MKNDRKKIDTNKEIHETRQERKKILVNDKKKKNENRRGRVERIACLCYQFDTAIFILSQESEKVSGKKLSTSICQSTLGHFHSVINE